MVMSYLRHLWCSVMLLCLAFAAAAAEPQNVSVRLDDTTDMPVQHYAGNGEAALLWLPSESGVIEQERALARHLSDAGIEVWLADPFSAYFLPTVESSMDQIPAEHLATLIDQVRERSGKRLFLVGPGRGALLALEGARAWQLAHPQAQPLGGAILISPKLYLQTPEPGLEGEFMPVVRATDLPIYILQPAKSVWRWKLRQIVPALSESGSDVYVRMLDEVRDRFYYRPDAVADEEAMAKQLPALLAVATAHLTWSNKRPRQPAAQLREAKRDLSERTDRTLRKYQGDPKPPALQLTGLRGERYDLEAEKGNVVLVNFWATWCPPCVHEMPSMQRLKEKFAGEPFRILAVNMAEDPATVRDFLDRVVQVDFPILMDRDGAALGRWKVFAFPTTYVVGKHGRIRYALFGAIDWDNPDVVAKVEGLLEE